MKISFILASTAPYLMLFSNLLLFTEASDNELSQKKALRGNDVHINMAERELQDVKISDHTPTIARALQADYFQLKLYWEKGFYWQEEKIEKRWCIECKGSCKSGSSLYIRECDDDDYKQRWILKKDKLSPHTAQDLCMYFKDRSNIQLRTCKDSRDEYQKFDVIKQNVGQKTDSYEFQVRKRCLTQRHHPKSHELLRLEPCHKPRKSDTSIWEFGGPWDGH